MGRCLTGVIWTGYLGISLSSRFFSDDSGGYTVGDGAEAVMADTVSRESPRCTPSERWDRCTKCIIEWQFYVRCVSDQRGFTAIPPAGEPAGVMPHDQSAREV